MKRIFVLLVLVAISGLMPSNAKALGLDRVQVTIINNAAAPQAGENIHLHIYRYDFSPDPNQVNITDIDAGSCTTDSNGKCEIWLTPGMPKDASGFYRGALDIRGFSRSLLWPGGSLAITLNVDQLQAVEIPDEPATGQTINIQQQPAVNWLGILVPFTLLIGLIAVVWWWRKGNRKLPIRFWSLLLALIFSLLFVTSARAAVPADEPDYCSGTGGAAVDNTRCYSTSELLEYLMRWGITELGTGAARSFDSAIWLVDRMAAGFFDLTVNTTILVDIKDAFLQMLTSMMPGVLRQIVAGPTGLFYIALGLSGVLLTIPLWNGSSSLVRPERAIAWGCVLMVLFISGGGLGYDLVNGIETLRSQIIKNVMSGTVDAKAVVTSPMGASDVSIEADTAWALPQGFQSQYFPDPERQVVTVYLFEPGTPIFGGASGNTEVETNDSMQTRQLAAGQSLIWALISIAGAAMLLLAALTFALLAVAAMLLILFLFAALPLGFFEFGNTILMTILGKYVNVVMLSLALAIFMRWITAGIALIGDPSDIDNAIHYLVILTIIIYALSVIASSAFRLLTESGQVFGQSLQAVLGAGGMGFGPMGMGAFSPAGAAAQGGNFQGQTHQHPGPSAANEVVRGALSAVGFQAASSLMRQGETSERRRGDVFQDRTPVLDVSQPVRGKDVSDPAQRQTREVGRNGGTSQDQKSAKKQQSNQPPHQDPFERGGLFDRPTPIQAKATSPEGWGDEQIQTMRTDVKQPLAEEPMVRNPSGTPGFENSTDEAIQQALRSGQVLGPAPQPESKSKEERA